MNKKAGSLALAAMFFAAGIVEAAGGKKAVESLPDSSFAAVEHGSKGEKIRHLPYRDASGQVNVALLRSALRMFKRVKWENPGDAQPALAALKSAKSQACAAGKMTCGKGRKTAKKGPRVKKAKKA